MNQVIFLLAACITATEPLTDGAETPEGSSPSTDSIADQLRSTSDLLSAPGAEEELTTRQFIEQRCGSELFAEGGELEGDTFSFNTCQILRAIEECERNNNCTWKQN